tara:strand:+ start:2106 stop:2726 length:621 start_codon:yes stop_codon:yes gene_type:complete
MNELSSAGLKLILDSEVGGGEEYYDKFLSHPTWPGAESGVTIGIGYDLGFTPRSRFRNDWSALSESVRERLELTIGIRGLRAREKVKEVKDILIPWEMAYSVYKEHTIPEWVAKTKVAFPGVDKLPKDVLGALTSLVFNRGTSMEGDRRREMRDIREAVQDKDLPAIAKHIRRMKRLWTGRGLEGLLVRRDAESKLVLDAAQSDFV